ncbi:uncharacterized protein LOC143353737 [Halictus rubicundus]|uniref:uncharacterized protein LOC143353737 n=1 Tax=Halictus rubicundus TaxID=77578 RepID=UPI004036B5BA
MDIARRMNLICLALVMLKLVRARMQGTAESSGEYLQKAMIQLQEFNVPPPVNVYDRLSWANNYNNLADEEKQAVQVQRINMHPRQKYKNQSYHVLLAERADTLRYGAENLPSHYQPYSSAITKLQEPDTLGFSRAELAAMYQKALERGTTVNLQTLTNALSTGDLSQVPQTHVEFPVKSPNYQYYFFPLKSFMSKYKKDHGYKTIPPAVFNSPPAPLSTQSMLSASPLFVAISTFVTMAVLFMMSVLFLPRLPAIEALLQSREIQDDFLHLSSAIVNAIDRYNLLESLKGQRVEYMR